ncbi:hypothetical protein K0U07_00845 [bacterium]|nr:hypothetical protein [bacterium]
MADVVSVTARGVTVEAEVAAAREDGQGRVVTANPQGTESVQQVGRRALRRVRAFRHVRRNGNASSKAIPRNVVHVNGRAYEIFEV